MCVRKYLPLVANGEHAVHNATRTNIKNTVFSRRGRAYKFRFVFKLIKYLSARARARFNDIIVTAQKTRTPKTIKRFALADTRSRGQPSFDDQ